MRIFFGGAEIGSHRKILAASKAENVAVSYMGIRRRRKNTDNWLVDEEFADFPLETRIFVDSGAYSINADSDVEADELLKVYEDYKTFVLNNLEDISMVSEFDALPLGRDWIEAEREAFWSQVPEDKFMVVWHPEWGVDCLLEMAEEYSRIGIPTTVLEGRNLRPTLNALAAKGTLLHGIAMTQIDEMQSIHWDSVASTSWISPQRFGDTIVWTGKELKRYPMKMKSQARKRHRTLFENEGFDAAAIEADDDSELLRLSVWSWQQFEGYINRHKGVVTPLFSAREEHPAQFSEDGVDTQGSDTDNGVTTPTPGKAVVRRREATSILPVMGLVSQESSEEGEEDDSPPLVAIRSESPRMCDTCFLSQRCPGFEPQSNCVYNIPIQVRTREQFKALNYGMVEMQAQRVMFMRMAEEIEGGYADPNLTKEIGMLNKMMVQTNEMEKEGFSLTINASGNANAAPAGMMTRIFGGPVAEQVQQIEGGPVNADDYIDVEIVGDED